MNLINVEQKPEEEVVGLTADPVRKTYWIYTNQSIYEVLVGNEDRDVWKIYLEKRQFDMALKYSKVNICVWFGMHINCRLDCYATQPHTFGTSKCFL